MNNIIIAHIGTDASGKLTTRVLDTAKVLGIARDAVIAPNVDADDDRRERAQ